jgi:chromosomal replication initiator protein
MVKEAMKTISVEMVQKSVSEFYRIPLSEMRAKKRHKNIVLPRQVAMYLSRQLTNLSLPEIGNAFGGKDHTTVLHSCKKIEREILNNGENGLKNTIRELTTTLKQ